MKILVINPNTSVSMTDHLRKVLEGIKRPDTELTVVSLAQGPQTLECAYDNAMAVPHLLDIVRSAGREGYEAVIIAAFCDPGLEAAREVSDILVVGLQEVTLHMAAMLGARYTIVSMTEQHVAHKHKEVAGYKLERSLASIIPLGLSVAQTDAEPELTKKRVLEVAKLAVEKDKAEVLVLGCAGMAGYAEEIEKQIKGVVVLDPASVTLKICEGMVDGGMKHAKRYLYAYPPKLERD